MRQPKVKLHWITKGRADRKRSGGSASVYLPEKRKDDGRTADCWTGSCGGNAPWTSQNQTRARFPSPRCHSGWHPGRMASKHRLRVEAQREINRQPSFKRANAVKKNFFTKRKYNQRTWGCAHAQEDDGALPEQGAGTKVIIIINNYYYWYYHNTLAMSKKLFCCLMSECLKMKSLAPCSTCPRHQPLTTGRIFYTSCS